MQSCSHASTHTKTHAQQQQALQCRQPHGTTLQTTVLYRFPSRVMSIAGSYLNFEGGKHSHTVLRSVRLNTTTESNHTKAQPTPYTATVTHTQALLDLHDPVQKMKLQPLPWHVSMIAYLRMCVMCMCAASVWD
eukprot:scpid21612/ scgid23596/ 